MNKSSPQYWDELYLRKETGWDIGYISTPLKDYFDQLEDKNIKILIPGAGNAYEVEYLFSHGFKNTHLLDFSKQGIKGFTERYPDFPKNQIIEGDFFHHSGQYDLIVEQTFFSSISVSLRKDYAKQCSNLLKPGGKLVGLLFGHHFNFDGPPYGGTSEEYKELFSPHFSIELLTTAYNSIHPRKDRELFFMLRKNPF